MKEEESEQGSERGDAAGQEQGCEGQGQRYQWGSHEVHSHTQALLLLLQ